MLFSHSPAIFETSAIRTEATPSFVTPPNKIQLQSVLVVNKKKKLYKDILPGEYVAIQARSLNALIYSIEKLPRQ